MDRRSGNPVRPAVLPALVGDRHHAPQQRHSLQPIRKIDELESLRGIAALLLVELFFVLSGFVIQTVYGNALQTGAAALRFQVPRFARLYPVHLLFLLTGVLQGRPLTVNDPAWSISVEFWTDLLFALTFAAALAVSAVVHLWVGQPLRDRSRRAPLVRLAEAGALKAPQPLRRSGRTQSIS